MTQNSEENVLFPEEIVPWDDVINLAINLTIPFRHRAKGIECITGRRAPIQQSPIVPAEWIPYVLNEKFLGFIKEHLQELPLLVYPISPSKANEFIDKFIMLKDSPDMLPSFLTSEDLNADREKRVNLFTPMKKDLEQLILDGDVFLVDGFRIKRTDLSHNVYFTKRGAIQYLETKALLDRAFSEGSTWRNLILEPDVEASPSPTEKIYYGLSKELINFGIQEYRKMLTLRKLEFVVSQTAQLPPSLTDSDHITKESQILSESAINSVLDQPLPIQNSSTSSVTKSNIKSPSAQIAIVPEDNKQNSINESPIIECKTTLLNETDSGITRLIGMSEVMKRLGVSRPTVYNYMKSDHKSYNPDFPLPGKLNAGNKWIEAEIDTFVKKQASFKKIN